MSGLKIFQGAALSCDETVEIPMISEPGSPLREQWGAMREAEAKARGEVLSEAEARAQIQVEYAHEGRMPYAVPKGVALYTIRPLSYRETIDAEKAALRLWPGGSRQGHEDFGYYTAEWMYQRVKRGLLRVSDDGAEMSGEAVADALHPEHGVVFPRSDRSALLMELLLHINRLTDLGPEGKARLLPPSG